MSKFIVHSTHALFWPTIDFRIKKGENRYSSKSAIPETVMAKLTYLSVPKKTRDGQRLPAVVRFYESSDAVPVDDDPQVDLTAESLSKLKFKDLQTLAEKLGVDHKGLTSKEQLRDALVAHAAGDDGDDDADLDDEDDDTDE
jgi:hypothetical protein